MARPNSHRSEKEQLIAAIEASRETICDDLDALAESINTPSRIVRGLASAPVRAAAASAAFGLVSTLLLGRKPGPARHRQPLAPLVRRALELLREPPQKGEKPPLERELSKLRALVEDWLRAAK